MNFAFYEPKEGVEPTMGDYMDEIEVFVKEPLEIVHEVLANLWEQGILGDSAIIDSALGTLWTCVLHLEFLGEFFHKELLKAKGIERDCIPRSSQERRLANNLVIRATLLPDNLKENVKLRLFNLEELRLVKKLGDHLEKSQRAKEDCEEVMEANEGAMAA